MNAIVNPPARLALIIDGVTVRTVARADQAGVQLVMRDFYAAQASGKAARILPIDDTAPAQVVEDDENEDTVEVPRAVMAAALAQPVAAGTVSAVAVARIEQQEAWATAAGFALPSTLFAAGTRCVQLGDRNFIAERRRVAELPAFDEAAREIAARIRAENRSDVQAPMSALSMADDGRLTLPDGRALTVTRSAFGQLAIRGGFGAGVRYLADNCDPARRALNVSADLANADKPAVLRTRNGGEVFAVVSPSYAAVDADRVLLAAAPVLADARGEVTYDGSSTRATALWMPDHVVDLACGDIFKAGVRVRTDDTGGGRIVVEAVLFRNRCLNLIIIGEAGVPTLQQVHRGDLGDIEGRIAVAVQEARDLIAPFLEAWGHARAVKVADPMETLRKLVYGGELAPPTKGEREHALEALTAAWRAEPGDSWADIANAATRAAHEDRDFTQEYRDHLETRAARLVYAVAA
jgi:hypothetical protein